MIIIFITLWLLSGFIGAYLLHSSDPEVGFHCPTILSLIVYTFSSVLGTGLFVLAVVISLVELFIKASDSDHWINRRICG